MHLAIMEGLRANNVEMQTSAGFLPFQILHFPRQLFCSHSQGTVQVKTRLLNTAAKSIALHFV